MTDDLELDVALGLDAAYHDWWPVAAERDAAWAWDEHCLLEDFAARENEALLDDIEAHAEFTNYWRYLRTRTWSVRAARAKRWGICQRCGTASASLDAHHLTYERLGRERPSDLVAICQECHRREHGR